jgi:hypothetical protein
MLHPVRVYLSHILRNYSDPSISSLEPALQNSDPQNARNSIPEQFNDATARACSIHSHLLTECPGSISSYPVSYLKKPHISLSRQVYHIAFPHSIQGNRCQNIPQIWPLTTSFHVISNSLFTNHRIILCYIVRATDEVIR